MTAIAGAWHRSAPSRCDGTVTVEADARLDERDALVQALGASGDPADRDDGELIRRAYLQWGDRCVERLIGDFAFVVRDGRRGRVLAARDPLGVRPFHYSLTTDRFSYATRVEDLFDRDGGVPCVVDEARVADALVPELEGIDSTSTFYRDVRRLAPGHRIVVEGEHASVARFWAPDPSRTIRYGDDSEYVEAFGAIFREAVSCRLDPRTASMLSGGLDSSSIVGVAREIRRGRGGPALMTFSAVAADGEACEETDHVRAVLAMGGLDASLLRRGGTGELDVVLDGLFESPAEPFDSAMIIPLLASAAARRAGADALLDGVDGDVVASLEPDLIDSLLRGGAWGSAIREARGLAVFYRGAYDPWSSAPRLLATSAYRAFVPEPIRRLRPTVRLAAVLRESLVRPEFAARVELMDRLATLRSHRRPTSSHEPRERHAAEVSHPYLAAAAERYHRIAANQGLEARHPFLDRRLVEFCLALPWNLKVRNGWSKWIVRRATAGILPESVRWRRGRWVRLGPAFLAGAIASRRNRLESILDDREDELDPYVDLRALRRIRARYANSGEPSDGETVWRLAHLATWLRRARASRYHAAARDACAGRAEAAATSRPAHSGSTELRSGTRP